MTLIDLEGCNSSYFVFCFTESDSFAGQFITVVEDRPIMSAKYCLPFQSSTFDQNPLCSAICLRQLSYFYVLLLFVQCWPRLNVSTFCIDWLIDWLIESKSPSQLQKGWSWPPEYSHWSIHSSHVHPMSMLAASQCVLHCDLNMMLLWHMAHKHIYKQQKVPYYINMKKQCIKLLSLQTQCKVTLKKCCHFLEGYMSTDWTSPNLARTQSSHQSITAEVGFHIS